MNEKNEKLKKLGEDINESYKNTIQKIAIIGRKSEALKIVINSLQHSFDLIRGMPDDTKIKCEETKEIVNNWNKQVQEIENKYNSTTKATIAFGAAGAALGVGAATLAPTAAMGLATTFGVSSTGTAISTLSGAAATKAALAVLGGGTIAAGGAGVKGGALLLALAGYIGWGIAAVSVATAVLLFLKSKQEKDRFEEIMYASGNNSLNQYRISCVELSERARRMRKETTQLKKSLEEIEGFGLDYSSMTKEQKMKLGVYVNAMFAATQLLITPIQGLQPKYTKNDFDEFLKTTIFDANRPIYRKNKDIMIRYANMFFGIEMTEKDYKLMWKSFRQNKEELSMLNISKKDYVEEIFTGVSRALEYKYST